MMSRKLLIYSANYSSRLCIFLSALALALGSLIYILLRPSEHVFYNWISAFGLDNWIDSARQNPLSLSPLFPEWFVFSFPNGLWAFAYALIITGVWSRSKSWLKYFWMASIPILVVGFEVLQLAEIISGTFSIQDIAFGLVGLVLGSIVGNKLFKSNNHEKSFE